MAFLHPYRSRNPTTPPAAMDHRRGALRTTDSGVGGNSASMSMALARSLVHSASAAAKGSTMPGEPVAVRLARRREGRARSGGGSGSGVGWEAAGLAALRRKVCFLGMPGWCSQEKGTEVVRGEGDGEDAAEETVEKDEEEEEDDE
jgi:hypothetical protein